MLIKRKSKARREIRKHRFLVPVSVVSWSASGTDLTVEFDQVVIVHSTPQYTVNVPGAEPISVQRTGPTTIVVTYDRDITATTEIIIPFQDPSVRSNRGGYVAVATVPA